MRNIDLAAHSSLINSEHFRRVTIMQQAKKFAVKISQVLAPFFISDSHGSTEVRWDGFATWGQDRDEWRETRSRLVDLFAQALIVKADSVLNIEDYEMVIYPPGTKFDKNCMTVETTDGMPELIGDHNDREVELCIQSGVFAYPRREPVVNAPINDVRIPLNNFLRKEASQRVGCKPLVKAVVILKN